MCSIRPHDDPIPKTEGLYFRFAAKELNGRTVLPKAVRLRGGLSGSREKYMKSVPLGCLDPSEKYGRSCVFGLRAGTAMLACHIDAASGNRHLITVADDPLIGIDAHAEVRVVRAGRPYVPADPIEDDTLEHFRRALARVMVLCYRSGAVLQGEPMPVDHPEWSTPGPRAFVGPLPAFVDETPRAPTGTDGPQPLPLASPLRTSVIDDVRGNG
jgi:hypothetical protein